MVAGQANITIEAGANYTTSMIWKDSTGTPINLTGWNADMWVKTGFTSTDVVQFKLSSTGVNPAITLGGVAGTIAINIPYTTTKLLQIGQNLVYDLMMTNTNVSPQAVTRLLTGSVIIVASATVIP